MGCSGSVEATGCHLRGPPWRPLQPRRQLHLRRRILPQVTHSLATSEQLAGKIHSVWQERSNCAIWQYLLKLPCFEWRAPQFESTLRAAQASEHL